MFEVRMHNTLGQYGQLNDFTDFYLFIGYFVARIGYLKGNL